jgi:Mrp family chromosome partitioning ATPase
MSLLDQAIGTHDEPARTVRKLEPENLRAFPLLSRHAPEKHLQEFRRMRSRLYQVRAMRELHGLRTRSLLITSPRRGEGKSYVALNLALMIAVAPEARILVVDLNVRRPSFQSRFRLPKGPGLEEIIAGADWREAAWWMPDTQLYVTTLSDSPRDIMDPLNYDRLSKRIGALESSFDWIIFDGPPLLETPDAEIASLLTDATLLVVRREETTFSEMDECVSRLAPGRLAGVTYNSLR